MIDVEHIIELYEERAAILEFDAGLDRQQAETEAFKNVLKQVGFSLEVTELLQGYLNERNNAKPS